MYKYSRHVLDHNRSINIDKLMKTLNCLRLVTFKEDYDITNTEYKSASLKESVMSYYKNEGVCKNPIVVTDDDFCLDGRHRVAFHKENNISTLPAYIVPRSQVDKFIESL